jgi:hypothetical protein
VATGDDKAEEPVPRLPFAKGLKLSWREIIRIATVAALLVVVIVTRESCGEAVSRFVSGFDSNASPQDEMPKPGKVQRIAPTATPDEQKAAVDRAKASP